MTSPALPQLRVAEFFAGIGLVRMALERTDCRVVFANDIDAGKLAIYAANFDASVFQCRDIRTVRGADVPDIEIATASFPCTDLSLAGNRAGLHGRESGLLAAFLRVMEEMAGRRPMQILLENVMGFASSNDGEDLRSALERLNALGYVCDLLALDARHFVPQSRPRLFIIGSASNLVPPERLTSWPPSALRPAWIRSFVRNSPSLRLQAVALPDPPATAPDTLEDVLDAFDPSDAVWWDEQRTAAFLASLSPINQARLDDLRRAPLPTHATAYRRTRHGRPVWEIRPDRLSGCLRTGRGGSSKQAVVEGGQGQVRVRWMTAAEYARLQGAPDLKLAGATEGQGRFALGDAVCVPAVEWLARHYLVLTVTKAMASEEKEVIAHASTP